jgi:putative heme-binding domain-containing protein
MRAFGLLVATLLVANHIVVADDADEAQRAKDERIVQTVLRLPGFDLNAKPEAKVAVLRHLSRMEGQDKYFELVDKLNLAADVAPALLQQAIANPESNAGANCASQLLKADALKPIEETLAGKDDSAAALLTALGLSGQAKALPLIEPVLADDERSVAVRSAAVRAIGKVPGGEKKLLAIVEQGKLASDLKFAAANVLLNSSDAAVKEAAGKHLSLPATADAKPLPTIPELVKMAGNASSGAALFANEKTQCSKCHTVNGQGKDVGPNLSEIGSKLSKEALYLSILDPSAGVSFNFETSEVLTSEGQVLRGIVVSDTAEALTLKTADAITRVIPKAEVDEVTKLKVSLMPQDLQRQLTAQDLVDIVEYLTILKKK